MKDETMMPPRSMWGRNEMYDEAFLRSLQYDEYYSDFERELNHEGSCGNI